MENDDNKIKQFLERFAVSQIITITTSYGTAKIKISNINIECSIMGELVGRNMDFEYISGSKSIYDPTLSKEYNTNILEIYFNPRTSKYYLEEDILSGNLEEITISEDGL